MTPTRGGPAANYVRLTALATDRKALMREIRTEVEIKAEPAVVWTVLTDFGSYAEWNPFIIEAKGVAAEGERLNMRFRPPGGSAMRMKPRVVRAEADSELRWLGHLGIPGIFDGEHYFELEPMNGTGTRLVQGEKFTGVTVPVFGRILRKTEKGFEQFNQALKGRCETTA
ncbi:MAG: SRPBCC domain-containing protein [Actinomycetota bacterium]|nr:SRPBCC domain-containing protein [Actinomycetota bacterium]